MGASASTLPTAASATAKGEYAKQEGGGLKRYWLERVVRPAIVMGLKMGKASLQNVELLENGAGDSVAPSLTSSSSSSSLSTDGVQECFSGEMREQQVSSSAGRRAAFLPLLFRRNQSRQVQAPAGRRNSGRGAKRGRRSRGNPRKDDESSFQVVQGPVVLQSLPNHHLSSSAEQTRMARVTEFFDGYLRPKGPASQPVQISNGRTRRTRKVTELFSFRDEDDAACHAREDMYDFATWKMYDRITRARTLRDAMRAAPVSVPIPIGRPAAGQFGPPAGHAGHFHQQPYTQPIPGQAAALAASAQGYPIQDWGGVVPEEHPSSSVQTEGAVFSMDI